MKKTLAFAAALLLVLCCALGAFAETTILPPYKYTGEDPIEGAVLEHTVSLLDYEFDEGCAAIPTPIIVKVEQPDETHAKVYGNFWVFYYQQEGKVLNCVSGGEFPGIMELEKGEEGWKVVKTTIAGDGEDYDKDIESFAAGDKELEDKLFQSVNLLEEPYASTRTHYISEYVKANNLDIDAYQDYGWDPVPLEQD